MVCVATGSHWVRSMRTLLQEIHMTTNPTSEEIVQVAQSGTTGAVKSLTDLRLEKVEAKIDELMKINAELRAANQELYSFASQQPVPQAQSAVQTAQVGSPGSTLQPQAVQYQAAAQIVQPEVDQAALKAKEEANLQSVLAELGYRKAPSQSSNNDIIKDGM